MSKILVLGAGLNGLVTALLLARDGHVVTVLERDPAGPNGGAEALWSAWERRGVNQFHHPHFMLPRWRAELERELPDVLAQLTSLGARRVNTLDLLPESMTGGRREGDDRFDTITARRPVLEAAVAAVAARSDGIDVRRGVTVTGLITDGDRVGHGPPHVRGVMTSGGETIHAELVIDATGRRSAVSSMLAHHDVRSPVEEREDTGFVYYMRHYRGSRLPKAKAPLLQHFDSVGILTLPCDGDTWAVGFVASAHDRALRVLRDLPTWERALAHYPSVAHWGDGAPLTGVQAIAGIEDRFRRLFRDGDPVVSGLVAVGDAWACSNPSLGRGTSIGLLHACALRNTLREVGTDEAVGLVRRFDELTESSVAPWYRATLAFDRHRLAEIDAEVAGHPYVTPDASWAMSTALYAAARRDPDLLRAHSAIAAMIATPQEVLSGPGLLERVIRLGANASRYPEDAPTRTELLGAIAAVPARTTHRTPPDHANGTARIHVHEAGQGEPVLLLHGWPDDHTVWRHQVSALVAANHRVLAPDLRGFGLSDKPHDVSQYGLLKVIADLLTLLDERELPRAHVIGHDWGGAIGAVMAALAPGRVASLTCLSVGHPAAFAAAGWPQREKSWYMLLFQFPGIAEQWLAANDFQNLRDWAGHPEIDSVVTRLADPAALTASLGLYRAVLPPQTLLAEAAPLPPIQAPTMGCWSTGDLALTEEAMTGTAKHVVGPWRYERIEGVGHWMQLEAPERLNRLLLDFLDDVGEGRYAVPASYDATGSAADAAPAEEGAAGVPEAPDELAMHPLDEDGARDLVPAPRHARIR
jgi:pimeloyl-ACP methyl ester carboxylesterase/2-polyprenyl-6-methoxyphenol hydroxylase-like FAD-dependent oxidoreductase